MKSPQYKTLVNNIIAMSLNADPIAYQDVNAKGVGLGCREAKTMTTEQKSASPVPEGVPQYVLEHGGYF
jgi:hypothetical protein